MTDALRRCPFWAVLLASGAVSGCIELSQLVFKLGLFEFDDIFNNVLGAVAGWCVFHILRSLRRRKPADRYRAIDFGQSETVYSDIGKVRGAGSCQGRHS